MRRVLLVEGTDDLHVICSLLKKRAFPETFRVEEKGGIDKLLRVFPVQVKASAIESVGVVIDADTDLVARWASLKALLVTLGYVPPSELPKDGLILEAPAMPRVGAWIMPDNTLPGMLEDFVKFLVPEGDPAWGHSEAVVEALPCQVARFSKKHISKAKIHTWLAWQEDPGTPMGLAVTKKYLHTEDPIVDRFAKWLEGLFVK